MMLDHFRRSATTVETGRSINAARVSSALAGASATAGQSATVLAEQAKLAAEQAKLAAIQARYWASPHVSSAVDWATPHVENVRRRGAEAAGPRVEKMAGKAVPVVDNAYEHLVHEFLPKAVAAVSAAAAATAAGADKAHDATSAKLHELAHTKPPKQRSTGATIFWVLTGLAAVGAAIVAWRRSGPTTDPWAEQPWEPVDSDGDHTSRSGELGDAADAVGEAAGGAVARTREATERAREAAEKAAERAREVAKKAAQRRRGGGEGGGSGTSSSTGAGTSSPSEADALTTAPLTTGTTVGAPPGEATPSDLDPTSSLDTVYADEPETDTSGSEGSEGSETGTGPDNPSDRI